MTHYLIVCRSVTQAQRLGMQLTSAGVPNRVFRSPAGLTERGCSYSVKIRAEDLEKAKQAAAHIGIRPVKIVYRDEMGYTEVTG